MQWNVQDLQNYVSVKFMSDSTKNKLSSELSSTNLGMCLVETPYIDKDFRDTFYSDFSKRFADICRDSIRVHLFSQQKSYLGFFTLRDTSPFNIGRSYMHPLTTKHFIAGYYCLNDFDANVNGIKLEVKSFPWMQQDVNVTRCAHIAMWTVIRYFSNKLNLYREFTLQSLSNLSDSNSRKIPSKGLTVEQIAQTMTRAGFSTEVYHKSTMPNIDNIFYRVCYSMIESGLPFVAGSVSKAHAIAILGHGLVDIDKIKKDASTKKDVKIFDVADYISSYISNNDNYLPYMPISRKSSGPSKICLEDIDVIIVPLHEKMYLDVLHLYERIIPSLERGMFEKDNKFVRRLFITSSKSFKKFVHSSSDKIYRSKNLSTLMPKFIWILEYFRVDNYPKEISYRFVLDATGANYKMDELILSAKLEQKLLIGKNVYDLDNELDKPYIGNLKEIK